MLLRIFYSFIFINCFICSVAQPSQNDIIINISTGGKSYKEIIQQIEKEYSIVFSYSDDILPTHTLPYRSFKNIPLNDFLDLILKNYGIAYDSINGQIVLFNSPLKTSQKNLSGFIKEVGTQKDLIGATVSMFASTKGTITNGYGFYSLKLPAGLYTIQVRCLGYENLEQEIYLWEDTHLNFSLTPKSYSMTEVLVNYRDTNIFEESNLINLTKVDIGSIREFPGLFGENDALRNISLIPGIQSNEMSTGSIYVRGGNTEQTIYMMDEAIIYNPSHFGGFFSVFNPDVVNNVNIYKGDLPSSEGGALSSLIDVRLREGNFDHWKVNGGIGIISARMSVEGPLKKDTSSLLFALRRTYVDQILQYVSSNESWQDVRFNFFDSNLKINYKLNKHNRFYLSGYAGSDAFNQYSKVRRYNTMASLRWNHLFNTQIFSNTSIIFNSNRVKQIVYENKEEVNWQSDIYSLKLKSDITQLVTKNIKLNYGYAGVVYNIIPYSYESISESEVSEKEVASNDQMLVNSLYLEGNTNLGALVSLKAGMRVSYMLNSPFSRFDNNYKDLLYEPNILFNFYLNQKMKLKASYNRREQPLHQLYLNMIGIAVNRWMSASDDFKPQKSNNYSVGFFRNESFNLDYSVEAYYRKMYNLIETLQEMRILYSSHPEQYLYPSSGTVHGVETSIGFGTSRYRGIISYDYAKVLWTTESLNNEEPYEASHAHKHNISISAVAKVNKRITASAVWKWASGTPFTAATGKYEVDGKVYLKYDIDQINTQRLPNYHRLDLSVDIEGKKNASRRWKSYWNFSVYNAYFHKNMLGVVYFSPDEDNKSVLNPQYFYLYQFVPSISYRFEF